jgi:hypothetical protein
MKILNDLLATYGNLNFIQTQTQLNWVQIQLNCIHEVSIEEKWDANWCKSIEIMLIISIIHGYGVGEK